MGIDGWAHIEHIKRPWVLSAHIGISAIHIRNPQTDILKNCDKGQTDGLILCILTRLSASIGILVIRARNHR